MSSVHDSVDHSRFTGIDRPNTSRSIVSSLLFSNDTQTIQQLTDSMEKLAIATEPCADLPIALRLVNRRKFEAIMVDFRAAEQAEVMLERVRLSPSNRTAVTLAITNRDTETEIAFDSGAKFVLERPLSPIRINRTLKAAYGLMMRERRRYFRCPINMPTRIRKDTMPPICCEGVNISEGGLAINTSVSVKPGTRCEVEFRLPGRQRNFAVESEVCWYDDARGRAGLHFLSLSVHQQSELQTWLSEKLEATLPIDVVQRFRIGDS